MKREGAKIGRLPPSFFLLHPSSFILHPFLFTLHPSSFILYSLFVVVSPFLL